MTADLYDISQLGLTAEPETVEPESYVPAYSDTNEPINAGTYSGKLVDGGFKIQGSNEKLAIQIGTMTSSKNGEKYLSAQFAVEVENAKVGEKTIGKRRVYGRVNLIPESLLFNKVKEGREKATSFADLLTSAGFTGTIVGPQGHLDALLALVAKEAPVKVTVDKVGYCNPNSKDYAGCGQRLKGEDSFTGIPSEDGGLTGVGIRVECPGIHGGDRPILLARNEIKKFYPAGKRA